MKLLDRLLGRPRRRTPADVPLEDVSVQLDYVFGESDDPQFVDGTGRHFAMDQAWEREIPLEQAQKRRRGFALSWQIKGRGFGEYAFEHKADGTLVCHNECDSREWVELVLRAFLARCILRDG